MWAGRERPVGSVYPPQIRSSGIWLADAAANRKWAKHLIQDEEIHGVALERHHHMTNSKSNTRQYHTMCIFRYIPISLRKTNLSPVYYVLFA